MGENSDMDQWSFRLIYPIEQWEEDKVTWNNQPKTTETNQVYLYPFVRNVNYIEVDVIKLFVVPAAGALPNLGRIL